MQERAAAQDIARKAGYKQSQDTVSERALVCMPAADTPEALKAVFEALGTGQVSLICLAAARLGRLYKV